MHFLCETCYFIERLIIFYGNLQLNINFCIENVRFMLITYHFYTCSFQDNYVLERIVNDKSNADNKLNYGPDKRSQAIKLLFEVLKRGLGDRINRLCVLPSICKEWECTEEIPNSIGKLVIGLELNPEKCFDIVEKGPEANLPEVSKSLK